MGAGDCGLQRRGVGIYGGGGLQQRVQAGLSPRSRQGQAFSEVRERLVADDGVALGERQAGERLVEGGSPGVVCLRVIATQRAEQADLHRAKWLALERLGHGVAYGGRDGVACALDVLTQRLRGAPRPGGGVDLIDGLAQGQERLIAQGRGAGQVLVQRDEGLRREWSIGLLHGGVQRGADRVVLRVRAGHGEEPVDFGGVVGGGER